MREREREILSSNTKIILTCRWRALNFISLLKGNNNNVLFPPFSPTSIFYFIFSVFIFFL